MNMQISGLDEVMALLEKLSDKGRVDDIAKKAVNAALPTLTASVRSHIHPRDVASGVSEKPAEVNQYGVFAVAKVTGHDSKGNSNAARAAVLEYGRHDKRGGHIPWRAAAAGAAEGPALKIAEEVIKAEMGCD